MHTTTKKRSLKQVILLSVGLLVFVLLTFSSALNFATSKIYVEEQLRSHSHEAATFLGLALSSQKQDPQHLLKERMIDSIFDSGDYSRILLVDTNEKVLISRQLEPSSTVPAWFISLASLNSTVGEAQVMDGWAKRGKVFVSASPSTAAEELWILFKSQAIFFVSALVVGLVGLYLMLRRLLKPLSRMEIQTQHIAHRSFDEQLELPTTRELDAVARSMNDMAVNLKRMFDEQLDDIERLRDQTRKDPLTGLFNREGFDGRLKSDLSDSDVSGLGVLLLVGLNDFGEINTQHGRQVADDLLVDMSKVLTQTVSPFRGAYIARRTGAQFSIFIPAVSAEAAEATAQKIMTKIVGLGVLRQALRDDWLNIGIAEITAAESVTSLLSKADLALRQAQGKGVSGWQRFVLGQIDGVTEEVRQANHWQKILQEVLANNLVVLHEQSVHLLKDDALSHKQVLSRIEVEGQLIVASTFLPMAKRFGLMVLFDEMVVEKVFEALATSKGDELYHITLSEAAIADELFMQWLTEHLQINKDVLPRVTFEIPEHALGFGEDILNRLCKMGEKWGFGICIDRFGVSSIPFTYLQRINVSALKIDPSFVRNVHENQDNQFFIRAAVQIAHSQDIRVVAIGVESEDELLVLRELGVDAAMGYVIQRPTLAQF